MKQKYITAGVFDQISLTTQMLIWQLAASLPLETDYLQIFRLKPGVKDSRIIQIIEQSQEQPEFQRTFSFYCEEPVNTKLFLIKDGDGVDSYETLLLAEEY